MENEKRLIDANALNKKKKYCFQTVGGCFPKSEWFIKADDLFTAPTVDSVEVVRCKDCRYQGRAGCPTYYEDSMTYRDCWALDDDNDFCSYGERRGGE